MILYKDDELCRAVWAGNLDRVRQCIGFGANVNCYNENGNTPLHLAVEQIYYDIAKLLLQSGADVNQRDRDGGWTPLVHAVDSVSDAAIQCHNPPENRLIALLLEHGADVTQKSWQGQTALDVVSLYVNPEAEAMLRAAGASL